MEMCKKLKATRLKRKRQRYYLKWKKQHPTHKAVLGHKFKRTEGKPHICETCGKRR